MRPADFHFDLPAELIAQQPLAERSASRLLALDGATGAFADRTMRELPSLLEPGDLLVFNDTRVVPARLHGTKLTGGRVEMLLERALEGSRALVQLKSSKGFHAGARFTTRGGEIRVAERHDDLWEVELPEEGVAFFMRWGEVPLPPYIGRAADSADAQRYQTVFAREPGAVAAPTASLHFDAELLARLRERGVLTACITLHVGAGTFQPVRVADIEQHQLHAERARVGAEVVEAVSAARAAQRRVIAVGTTVARALESAAAGGELRPMDTDTRIFIRPGYRFRSIDALVTNFHLPESTLLMLVSAFATREHVLAAYRHAVLAAYRFFSYGDAMFVTPHPAARA